MAIWASSFGVVVLMIIALSGWGVYRFRETKAMTLNEFLEIRYSRRFKIFCGFLCFLSGVLNMGIFPVVGGRFIVYFCRLPLHFDLLGISISTVAVVTGFLVGISLLLAFKGGQVSLIITDFMQWAIIMFMFVAVGFATYRVVNWDDIGQSLLKQDNPKVYLDPFLPTAANKFGLFYLLMFSFRAFYNVLSWAPNTSRSQSATEAREAKMMWILSYMRQGANIGLLFGALACFAVANMPRFFDISGQMTTTLDSIANPIIRTEMAVPIFLSLILPPFIQALFVAGMISAAISTLDTYFLSWSGVLVQDVISPLSKKEISPQKRLKMLKWSVAGVAIFVYIFSLMWKPTDYIWMYFAVTASIYTGGAGAVILGALYWKKGTTAGAWSSMLTGSILAISSIFLRQAFVNSGWWPQWIDGMVLSVGSSLMAIIVFVVVSLITNKEDYDLDSLLNRTGEPKPKLPSKLKRKITIEVIISIIIGIILLVTMIAFWYNRTHDVAPQSWVTFWKWYSFIVYAYSIPIAIWFFIGGVVDLKALIVRLRRLHSESESE